MFDKDYTVYKNIQLRWRENDSLVYSSVHGNAPNMSTPAICDHNSNKQTIKWVKKNTNIIFITSYWHVQNLKEQQ